MFGFEIRLSKVALWNFMCLVCFFETVCSEDWMTMGETLKLKELTTTDSSEMNLSCQEPLTCLFVGYSHTRLFVFAIQNLEWFFEKDDLDEPVVMNILCSLWKFEVRLLTILCFCFVFGTNASPRPPMFPCHRGRIGIPWEKYEQTRAGNT